MKRKRLKKRLQPDALPSPKKRKPHRYRWTPTPEDLQKIEQLAGTGLNRQQIAHVLGVSTATFDRRKAEQRAAGKDLEDDSIDAAIKRGQSKAIAIVTNALFQKAQAGDNVACIFFLKNRAGWRDSYGQEISGPNGEPVAMTMQEMTMEQRAAKLAQLLNMARHRKQADSYTDGEEE